MSSPPDLASSGGEDEVSRLKAELERVRQELEDVKLSASPPLPPDNLVGGGDDDDSSPNDPFAVTFYTLVIFGAEGNLAMKKTFPALFTLMRQRRLPADVAIVGYARDPLAMEQFRQLVYRSIYNIGHPESDRQRFLRRITYAHGQFDDPAAFSALRSHVEERERE